MKPEENTQDCPLTAIGTCMDTHTHTLLKTVVKSMNYACRVPSVHIRWP